jgi:hypothetical protein
MAGIVVVDDPSDPRLADYARLTDVRLRTALEPAHGLFVAEGDKVIRRAVAAGFQVRSMLVTQDKLAGLADVAGACPGPVTWSPTTLPSRSPVTACTAVRWPPWPAVRFPR